MSEPIDYEKLGREMWGNDYYSCDDCNPNRREKANTLRHFIEHPTLFQEVAKKMRYYSNEYFQKARDEGWDACEQSLQAKLSQAEKALKLSMKAFLNVETTLGYYGHQQLISVERAKQAITAALAKGGEGD